MTLSLVLLLGVWIALEIFFVEFFIKSGVPRLLAIISLPFALLHWVPMYLDRSSTGVKRRSYPVLKRFQFNFAFFVFSLVLIWGNLTLIVAPAWTSAFGAPETRDLVVTQKSSGVRVRRGCDYYVHLQYRDLEVNKLCMAQSDWVAVQAGEVLHVSGKRSIFGFQIDSISRAG